MQLREYIEKIRLEIVKCAKKHKWVRYIVICIIAVYLFIYHLLKGREREWRQLAAGSVAVMLVITLTVHVQASVIDGVSGSAEETVEWTDEALGDQSTQGTAAGESEGLDDTGSQTDTESSDVTENTEDTGSTEESGTSGESTEETPTSGEIESTEESESTEETGSTDESVSDGDQESSEESESSEEPGNTGEDEGTGSTEGSVTSEVSGNTGEESSEETGSTEGGMSDVPGSLESNSGEGQEGTQEGTGTGDQTGSEESGITQEPGNTDDNVGLQPPEVTEPAALPVKIISRNSGSLADGIFFAGKDAWYEIEVNGASDVSGGNSALALKYQIGEEEYSASISSGKSIIHIPDGTQAELVIYSRDSKGQNEAVVREYIISDQESPVVSQKVIQKEDKNYYLQIEIKDQGNAISGIKEYTWAIDGEMDNKESGHPLIQYQKAAGAQLQAGITVEILLKDFLEHTLKITAQDQAGNHTEEEFVYQAGSDDIISVVVPTKFNINMYPGLEGSEGVVQSNDIIICNRSGFPVEVSVSRAKVNIAPVKANEAVRKCNLNLGVKEANREEHTYMLPEGDSADLLKFILSETNAATNPQMLIKAAQSGSNQEQIKSSDYAALKLYGNMNAADWGDGDLSVKLVFDFKRSLNNLQ